MPIAELAGVYAKLDWAGEHIDTLGREVIALQSEYKSGVSIEYDEDAYQWGFVLRRNRRPPLTWGYVVSDAIQNLRATLDYLVYQAAVLESGFDPPPRERDLMFPIFLTPTAFTRNGAWRIKTLSPDLQSVVVGLQPYKRRKSRDALHVLNELAIADKHRRLQVVAPSVRLTTTARHPTGEVDVMSVVRTLATERLEHVLKFPGLFTHVIYADVEMNVDASFRIAFDKAVPLVGGQLAMGVLHWLAEYVAYVIEEFEPLVPGQRMFWSLAAFR